MGMRHVNHDYDLSFDDPENRWWSEHVLLLNLMILAARNYQFLQQHPETPHLYDAGMIYQVPEQLERRPTEAQLKQLRAFLASTMGMGPGEIQHHLDLARGVEIFRDIPRIIENGGGDCDNLAAWRAAELSVCGVTARPYMTCRQQGGRTIYHALVKWPDGSSEDPSLILGMGGASRAAERREECRKNVERYDNYWQSAKELLDGESFPSRAAKLARAQEIKARIDALGLLPKDGVFRVGPASGIVRLPPREVAAVSGLDAFIRRAA